MKIKSFRKSKDWKDTWLQTALSVVSLVAIILISLGVITPEQSAEAQPLISTFLGAVSSGIIAVSSLIAMFTRPETPVE